MVFRLRAKTLWLTYPRCTVPPADALAALRNSSKWDVVEAYCVQEEHKDGTPHLHIWCSLRVAFSTSDPKFADFVTGQHGNYAVGKDKANRLKYMQKSKKAEASFGFDVADYLKAQAEHKTTKSDKVVEQLRAGLGYREVVADAGGFGLLHLKRIREYADYLAEERKELATRRVLPFALEMVDPDTERRREIRIGFELVPLRMKHWWLVGPTNVGKTHIFEMLKERGVGFEIPANDDWTGYSDQTCQFLHYDEFVGQISWSQMNRLCNGTSMRLHVMGAHIIKNEPKLIVVTSNKHPGQIYKNLSDEQSAAFERRWEVVEIERRQELRLLENDAIATDSEISEDSDA